MVILMDFSEIDEIYEDFEDWDNKDRQLQRLRKAHRSFRAMWDGVKKAKRFPDDGEMPMSETVINELRRVFPSDANVMKGRPLGDFKDIMEADQEIIYDKLCEEFTRTRKANDGHKRSFKDEMEGHCQWLWDSFFKDEHRWLKWTPRAYSQGISLMLYSSSIGILLENKVHHQLEEWLSNQTKASELFTYERAEAETWESKDVDGLFKLKSTGEIAVKVSIKCKRALDRGFIEDIYRNKRKKGKTEPDIYIGYRMLDEKTVASKISAIEIDGSLKDLLRRAL